MAFTRVNKALGLSLEKGTDNVPDDGRFYLILNGKIIRTFNSEKKAMEGFNKVRKDLGWEPIDLGNNLSAEEKIQQERLWMEYYRSEEYWGSAGSFRSGGKLSNR